MQDLLSKLLKFRDERDWKQFHTPHNLAKSISIEAAELLECFQWTDKYDIEEVKSEVADVYTYLLFFAEELNINLEKITLEKLEETKKKYPVEKAKGNATKYNKYKR